MTEGGPNSEITRSFSELSPRDKIKAVLAGTRQPVSRSLAYNLAGIDMNQLDENELTAINSVFSGTEVTKSDHEQHGDQYIIPKEQQSAVFSTIGIDAKAVNGQIADVLWKEFFGDEMPDKK